MFVIPASQQAAFRERGLAELRDALVAHARACFPRRCANIGADALPAHVEDGMRRAAAHGLTLERDIGAYVDLTIVFGPGFEHDSHCPWASLLTEATDLDPSARIQATFAGALAALSSNP
jgi:hypothetical protein